MRRAKAIIIIVIIFLSLIWVNHHPIMASSFNINDNNCQNIPAAPEKLCCLVATDAVEIAPIIKNGALPIIVWFSSSEQLLNVLSPYSFLNKGTHPPNIILSSLRTIIKKE